MRRAAQTVLVLLAVGCSLVLSATATVALAASAGVPGWAHLAAVGVIEVVLTVGTWLWISDVELRREAAGVGRRRVRRHPRLRRVRSRRPGRVDRHHTPRRPRLANPARTAARRRPGGARRRAAAARRGGPRTRAQRGDGRADPRAGDRGQGRRPGDRRRRAGRHPEPGPHPHHEGQGRVMAKRRRPKTRRSSGRTPRHVLHAIVKTVREVCTPGRHRTGDRTLSGRRRPNPWPKCPGCHLRRPPDSLCAFCGNCAACCPRCDRCGECALNCPGHDPADSTGHDAH